MTVPLGYARMTELSPDELAVLEENEESVREWVSRRLVEIGQHIDQNHGRVLAAQCQYGLRAADALR